MTEKLLKHAFVDEHYSAFWLRLEQLIAQAGSNAADFADHCGCDCLLLLDKDFAGLSEYLPVIAQSLGCSLDDLIFGCKPQESVSTVVFKPKMSDRVQVIFKDGNIGNYTVIAIEASAYIFQYAQSHEVVAIAFRDILSISPVDLAEKNISLDQQGSNYYITLRGRFDESSSADWNAIIQTIHKNSPSSLSIDCGDLNSISSTGIGMFVSVYKLSKDLSCIFALKNPHGQVFNTLKDTGLDKILMGL